MLGTFRCKLSLQTFATEVEVLVLPGPPADVDLILGDEFFKRYSVSLNYGDRAMLLTRGKSQFRVPCKGSSTPAAELQLCMVMEAGEPQVDLGDTVIRQV
eukprot:CAMPEP_0202880028 /NCGR_PEP_ID=MMETSP1391-20130828/34480_1 /ASSEMBLY_ACC=CAM_ASM_000867 /TAXON_ID=1034604 /ORGANISM="Chlamydomonas leiostraca, Strain SAG 11-49" /LENGTH=99 /DNA_ID=CAMNT_0049562467 /DNA_START=388 /DNA_END=684 /DNA_ORIENTATION=+